MSQRLAASRPAALARRVWNSPRTATQRLALSWTRWLLTRAQKAEARRRAKLEPVLRPLLLEALTPVAEAMARLEARQQESQLLVLRSLERLEHPRLPTQEQQMLMEQKELLLEVLNSLQPPPEREIAQQLGLPLPPTSPRSSVS